MPTVLYSLIEEKDWDGASARASSHPEEVRTWVSRREPSDRSKLRWRLLPIHATCVFRSPLSLMDVLLQAYPEGAQQTDDQGMLPVHLACRNGASKGVVLTLLHAFPAALKSQDRKGRLPIDLVQNSNSQNKESVRSSIRTFQQQVASGTLAPLPLQLTPSARSVRSSNNNNSNSNNNNSSLQQHNTHTQQPPGEREVDYEHRTVLFRLVLKKDWTAAASRSKSHPQEAATFIVTKGFHGNLRFLPLHKACVLQPPAELVEQLLLAYPAGAMSHDQDAWLPLHCASFYGASVAVMAALLHANTKGSQQKDTEGRLALHYACLKGASTDVVTTLLNAYPKGSMSKDDEGRLPLHHACSKKSSDGVIEALLKASPRGAQSKDDQGRLALHHACRKQASERTIRTLLKVYPRSAQIKDDQDKLPLHYYVCNAAASTNPNTSTSTNTSTMNTGTAASESIVQLLLETYPESVNVKNGFGYTPEAEARAMDNPKLDSIIQILVDFNKAYNKDKALLGLTASSMAGGENTHMHQVDALTQRVAALETVLQDVSKTGREMKLQLRRSKDIKEVMIKFADKLASIQIFGSSENSAPAEPPSRSSTTSTSAPSTTMNTTTTPSTPPPSSRSMPGKKSLSNKQSSSHATNTSPKASHPSAMKKANHNSVMMDHPIESQRAS
jgi:ankyrin repeat protein